MKKLCNIISTLLLTLTFISIPKYNKIERVQQNINNPRINSEAEIVLNSMSIEQKVGQLFIFGFDDTLITEETRTFLNETNIGGVLLFRKNITSQNQLKTLTDQLQNIHTIPMFISIDQEGGVVSRIDWDSDFAKSQGSVSNAQEAYELAKTRGDKLRSYGINTNFAPVVEYITDTQSFMYNRVYRGNINEVVEKSIATVNGYTDSNILSVIKHYPGHSNTSPDSHYDLPVVSIRDRSWNSYISTFQNIIEDTNVPAVMVGHIKFPNIDNEVSTLSNEIINNRLIKDLEYNGIVISDDMQMGALENMGCYKSIAKQALLAGNDILIYSKYTNSDPRVQYDVYHYIVDEVKNGNIQEDIIDKKVMKILNTKLEFNILNFREYRDNP